MFSNKVILITGASSGIGAQTARDFSKLEANLVLVGRNKVNLENVVKQCREISPKNLQPLSIIADISIKGDVENVIKKTIDYFKKLDVLVHNAAILSAGGIETMSLQQYDTIMNINMRGPYYLTILAAPHLTKTKGCIVSVSSVAGIRAFPNIIAYSISKAALAQFTKCLAIELAPKDVRANTVSPGDIETGIHRNILKSKEQYDDYFINKTREMYPLGRVGKSEEVSGAIIFLASDTASDITGVDLPVDGGLLASCPR